MPARMMSRRWSWAGLGLLVTLLSALDCARPETVLRERPAQRIEVVPKLKALTSEEADALSADLARNLGLPTETPAESTGAPVRVLRVTLRGGPNPAESWGEGKTCLVSLGEGALFGGLLGSGIPFYVMPTSWKGPGIGTAVGLVFGAIVGPIEYRRNQATLRELGYLPWRVWAQWEVLDRAGGRESVAARSRDVPLDLRPHLHPVPDGPGRVGRARQENLTACAAELARRISAGAARP